MPLRSTDIETSRVSTTPESEGLVAIRRALIAVSDKTGIVDLAEQLQAHGVLIYASGGTAQTLKSSGITTTDLNHYTEFPSILDGRVKTLHPMIHGGILADRNKIEHLRTLHLHGIQPIDLVITGLYPFAQSPDVETIDIGGSALMRAAAKNHTFVVTLSAASDYEGFLEEWKRYQGHTSMTYRRKQAGITFARSSTYDAAISSWLAQTPDEQFPTTHAWIGNRLRLLRYGENPHQQAAIYANTQEGIINAPLHQGKPLTYNNLVDAHAAVSLCAEFTQPTVAIVKHATPCGVASAENPFNAWKAALHCDPQSSFGGIVAVNRPITQSLAAELRQHFIEVLIAPKIESKAHAELKRRHNMRVLTTPFDEQQPPYEAHSVSGGFLLQQTDNRDLDSVPLTPVSSDRALSDSQISDLRFALKAVRHIRSNAIVIAYHGASIGIGGGFTSRVEAAEHAVRKAQHRLNDCHEQAVAASDGFFPFPDALEILANAGVKTIVHPGGSKQDANVEAAARTKNVALLTTGVRLFRHG